MFSLHGFASSTAAAASLPNQVPLVDPVAAVSGNFLYVPTLNQLIGAYACGVGLLRAQISTPSLLADVPYDITPVDLAAVPSSTVPVNMHQFDPIALVTNEPMQALMTHTNTEYDSIFVFLADGPIAKVSGRILRVRATFTTGTSQTSWNNAAITLTNQLAEGNYQLVGARVEGAHVLAARFVFPGANNSVRPGLIASTVKNAIDPDFVFRNGNLGVWGTFSNRVLPSIDHVTYSTSETAVLIMDLIKTA